MTVHRVPRLRDTVLPVTTLLQHPEDAGAEASPFRQRLLDGLAASIADKGYRATTVADIVRRARTSRRTFYEHFTGKEACFIALLAAVHAQMIREISAAVDRHAPWGEQVKQAVRTWVACTESEPALTVAWIRDVPALGESARGLQREMQDAFVEMVRELCDTEEWHASGAGPVSQQEIVVLLGGLRELVATTLEDGGSIGDITEVAVRSSIALLRPDR